MFWGPKAKKPPEKAAVLFDLGSLARLVAGARYHRRHTSASSLILLGFGNLKDTHQLAA